MPDGHMSAVVEPEQPMDFFLLTDPHKRDSHALPDALPIWGRWAGWGRSVRYRSGRRGHSDGCGGAGRGRGVPGVERWAGRGWPRSEEHTSELQSREKIVCRLLREKKK